MRYEINFRSKLWILINDISNNHQIKNGKLNKICNCHLYVKTFQIFVKTNFCDSSKLSQFVKIKLMKLAITRKVSFLNNRIVKIFHLMKIFENTLFLCVNIFFHYWHFFSHWVLIRPIFVCDFCVLIKKISIWSVQLFSFFTAVSSPH